MTTLETLTAEIHRLVPELLELSFGQRITYVPDRKNDPELCNRHFKILRNNTQWGDIHQSQTPIFVLVEEDFAETRIVQKPKNAIKANPQYKILGHPITLEHCRVAIDRASQKDEGATSGKDEAYVMKHTLCSKWQDLTPFEQQTELHAFLSQYLLASSK